MKTTRMLAAGTIAVLIAGGVSAQSIEQVLDSVYMSGHNKAAELPFGDPTQRAPLPEYIDRGIGGTNLRGCTLTAIDGLYCLDIRSNGKFVRRWPSPARVEQAPPMDPYVPGYDILNCDDVPQLNSRKDDTCTAFTVDLSGTIWLGGKDKGKTYSLVEAIELPDAAACPAGYDSLPVITANGNHYCSRVVSSGRPLLADIDPVDGDLATKFTLFGAGPMAGLLTLEERKTATFTQLDGTTTEIASGKRGWGLNGPEQLQSIALLQLPDSMAQTARNYVLVTTTEGRVLAFDTSGGGSGFEVFDTPGQRRSATLAAGPCNGDEAAYSVRSSAQTGLVYVTDSQYCEVAALRPVVDSAGKLVSLTNAIEGGDDLTLSTRISATEYIAPDYVTVSPGVSIDLNDCADSSSPCKLVVGDTGSPIATLSGVRLLDTTKSGLSLFQIENMPDCRYIPDVCLTTLGIPDNGSGPVESLIAAGVIVPLSPFDPVARLNPAAQRLNLTKLLPVEITDLFNDPLPDLLLSRQYRGQKSTGFTFGAFFGRTEAGVVFRDTFAGEFNIDALAGTSLGCSANLGSLDWDVIATVSERYVSASTPVATSDPQHVTTIINNGCGSTRSIDDRWSLKPYNLEMTPCTYNPDSSDNWSGDGRCVAGDPDGEIADDAVFGKLLLTLVDEFGATLSELACTDSYNENGGVAPLGASACSTLQADLSNTKDKLDKCWDATQQPKQSSGNQNCQAFDVQLAATESDVAGLTPVGPDVANRVGELKARIATIRHVYDTRFMPSLPADGFAEPEPELAP